MIWICNMNEQQKILTHPRFDIGIFRKFQAGAALLEVIVAVGIVTLVMTTIVSLVTVSLKSATLAQAKSVGTKYAQEGLESMRGLRAQLGWDSFVSTLTAKGTTIHLCMPTVPSTVAQLALIPNAACTNTQYIDAKKIYQRQADILITSVSGQTNVAITVTVSWYDAGVLKTSVNSVQFGAYTVADAPVQVVYSPLPYGYGVDAGMVGYWKFDEGTGSLAYDSSGNLNTGSWNGTLGSQWRTGIVTGAGNFNGSNNYVSVANSPSLDITGNQITMSAWFYANNTGNYGRILSKQTPTGTAYYAMIVNNTFDGIYAAVRTSAGAVSQNIWYPLLPSTWTHAVITYDGANVKLYINGVFVNQVPLTGTISSAAPYALTMGNYLPGPSQWYSGALDEVKIYNYALSAAQVLADDNSYVSAPANSPVYLLFNGHNDYLLTASLAEKNSAVAAGYTYQGVGFYAYTSQPSGTVPIYRLSIGGAASSHFYTASLAEKNSAVASGWTYEGVAFYAYTNQPVGTTPIYRLNSAEHYFTASAVSKASLVASGWTYEGVGFYAYGTAH